MLQAYRCHTTYQVQVPCRSSGMFPEIEIPSDHTAFAVRSIDTDASDGCAGSPTDRRTLRLGAIVAGICRVSQHKGLHQPPAIALPNSKSADLRCSNAVADNNAAAPTIAGANIRPSAKALLVCKLPQSPTPKSKHSPSGQSLCSKSVRLRLVNVKASRPYFFGLHPGAHPAGPSASALKVSPPITPCRSPPTGVTKPIIGVLGRPGHRDRAHRRSRLGRVVRHRLLAKDDARSGPPDADVVPERVRSLVGFLQRWRSPLSPERPWRIATTSLSQVAAAGSGLTPGWRDPFRSHSGPQAIVAKGLRLQLINAKARLPCFCAAQQALPRPKGIAAATSEVAVLVPYLAPGEVQRLRSVGVQQDLGLSAATAAARACWRAAASRPSDESGLAREDTIELRPLDAPSRLGRMSAAELKAEADRGSRLVLCETDRANT
jgi:hypothetical protein